MEELSVSSTTPTTRPDGTAQRVVWQGRGRWLAVTAPTGIPRIGVVGATREEAERRFEEAMLRWESYRSPEQTGSQSRSVSGM